MVKLSIVNNAVLLSQKSPYFPFSNNSSSKFFSVFVCPFCSFLLTLGGDHLTHSNALDQTPQANH